MSTQADQAFQQLKEAVMTAPVLQMPNFHLPLTIESDASDKGVGAMLSQNEQPIAFFHPRYGSYSAADLHMELMAMFWLCILKRVSNTKAQSNIENPTNMRKNHDGVKPQFH